MGGKAGLARPVLQRRRIPRHRGLLDRDSRIRPATLTNVTAGFGSKTGSFSTLGLTGAPSVVLTRDDDYQERVQLNWLRITGPAAAVVPVPAPLWLLATGFLTYLGLGAMSPPRSPDGHRPHALRDPPRPRGRPAEVWLGGRYFWTLSPILLQRRTVGPSGVYWIILVVLLLSAGRGRTGRRRTCGVTTRAALAELRSLAESGKPRPSTASA